MWALGWPWVLVALPLPWLVRRFLPPVSVEREAALEVPAGSELAGLSAAGSGASRFHKRLVALWLVWALLVFAAARPELVGDAVALPMTGRDLLLAVDLSGSMEEQDFELNGQWVNRLQALKVVADDFIERRVGDRVGLILFGREAYLQTPLTFDRKTVRTLLDEAVIGLAGKETAIGDAIGLAIRTLEDAGVRKDRRVLLLLTDGANTAGAVDPLKAAELAAQRGLIIYTVGLGADALTVRSFFGLRQINPSADLDERTLSQIADMTGGKYFRVRDTKGFQELYRELDKLEPAKSNESGFRPIKDLFYWPLALALAIGLATAVVEALGGRRRLALPRREAAQG
jgi:Ca-activated chloride channel family protein